MAYNANASQRVKEAKDDLTKKLILEQLLISDLRKYYKTIISQAKMLYLTTNKILDVSIYKSDLQAILKNHYTRVFKQFGNLQARQLSQLLGLKSALNNYQLMSTDYINQQSQQQANTINKTDQNQLSDAFKAAIALWFLLGAKPQGTTTVSPITGIPQSNEVHPHTGQRITPSAGEGISSNNLQMVQSQDILQEVSKTGTDTFKEKTDNRQSTIAVTETQNPAETSKALAVLAYITSADIKTANKEWNTILDGRERPWHHEAHGQIRKMDEPYIVYGQQLMYPGDTSLGATPDNIINCRCSSHYYW